MTLRRALLGTVNPVQTWDDGRVGLFGIPLSPLCVESAATALAALLSAGRRGIAVFTPDAHAASLAIICPERAELYRTADLVLCDGAGLAWAARCLARPVPRAPGVDVALALCRHAHEKNWSIYLLGGRPGVADLAARRLERWLPGAIIVGTHHGYFSDNGPVEEISARAPDVLLVAMGCPRQERWILKHRDLGAGIMLGAGGTFDVWAGLSPRAPALLQRLGLEWLWRAARHPARIPRLWAVPFLLYHVAQTWLRLHAGTLRRRSGESR